MKKLLLLLYSLLPCTLFAQIIISDHKDAGAFPLVANGHAATIIYDREDDPLVHIAANLFAGDIQMVSGHKPALLSSVSTANNIVIIGTVGKSKLLQQLIAEKKINVGQVKGEWEGYQVQAVKSPFKGVDQALIIVGNDKRGAAYGVFELSGQMGVSPWYWWADVPVKRKAAIYVRAKQPFTDAPKVKYRGIFINDEAPAFSRWTKEKFGGVNHLVYEKVFELLLRLKANYLWPAMWNNAFNDDDKMDPVLADKWGIVMGTSHHEPMQRAQQEWKRYGQGPWDYEKNDSLLRSFWRQGIINMGMHESLVTIGMRGDGDKPMTEGTATALLERIVSDQRQIIREVTGKPASGTPQIWALYKEVQEYYDKGMRVPDDVTLLLSDDNWGNIRKLPKLNDKPRSGGYGIYYHFDYVGDPRNYKWINTNNIARVWEQMHLAWEYKARQVWVVNVGDLKPMEFPISFFLDYAWNPTRWTADNLNIYYTNWAENQFGAEHAKEIGDIMRLYARYAARRKPELVDADTYSIQNYNETQTVVNEFNDLLARAEKVNAALPPAYRDAFFELVLHPLKANANLHEMYKAVALNRWYADRNDRRANSYADTAKQLYNKDSLISVQYNRDLAGGKWNHMMDQVHIGYKIWNDPPVNKMPEVRYVAAGTSSENTIAANDVSKTAESLIPPYTKGKVFFEKDGYVSIEAEHFSKAISSGAITWKIIPDIGRTGSGISHFPVTAATQQPGLDHPHTAYDFYTCDAGNIRIAAYFSPTLNFHNEEEGLQYAISVDDEKPQIINLNTYKDVNVWRSWVANNIIIKKSDHHILAPGKHTLKYWMVQPGIVLQKLVIDLGGEKPSYLGPPETLKK
ncbi:glycosyl hydrolase 115 family protein [Mucilaginibacter sp. SJ]|uniref:glycosyl hydrolase 115 family protein n=1 Tax=Mucilaginibacter sp. SJ TaxID=3029053 RepID=UPI0023A9DC8D|nr:glycosyl hydrolase 115 family protein [Mucilaginibacter sp. SJ]WEA00426.1 glycosyl hydrolase 115 family protein [Mucilaginibacter sp. SJ]